MKLSDTTTKLGLVQASETALFGDDGYGQISDNANRLYQFVALYNRGQDRYAMLAMKASGRWQFDDDTFEDYPIATTNLVSGQRDYVLSTSHLEIEKVLIKDSSGNWVLLKKTIDTSDTFGSDSASETYLENNSGNSGMPTSYDKLANSLFFDKAPNYSQTGGIKIYFKRGPNYLVYSDPNGIPGIPSMFHSYLCAFANAEYATDKVYANADKYVNKKLQMEADITAYHSSRNKDEKPRFTSSKESTR